MAYRSSSGGGRRGFAPRRGRGGTRPSVNRPAVKLDTDKHPLGELLTTINISELDVPAHLETEGNTIKDCEYIASYSWTDAKSPTILVPGRPPLWTPLQGSQRLRQDVGPYFRDPNAAKFPKYPLEPVVRALFECNPSFATDDVEIFACGSTLGDLLRFARSIEKPFRFNVEHVGSTMFFLRKGNDPREIIEGIRGYGHTFPDAYTTWDEDVKGSWSNQRLCRYTLGRFKCVMRYECDGYLPRTTGDRAKGPANASSVNDLISGLTNVAVSHPPASDENEALAVQSAGTTVPQDDIFDLKTRSGKWGKDIDMEEIYPALWLKQVPNFIVAYHDSGTFRSSDIHVRDERHGVQSWERENSAAIQRLAMLLERILEIVKNSNVGLLEVYCPGIDRLEIREQYKEGVHVLPPELRKKWKGSSDSPAVSDSEDGDDTNQGGLKLDFKFSDDDDFTACGDDCGYCGKCTY